MSVQPLPKHRERSTRHRNLILMLSKEEKTQYSRHLILNEIGTAGQEQLKKAKVLVIGAGGLGCPVLQYLSAAGIGTIGIIDHDVVDQSNLQRQILYTHNDIGKYKASVAASRLALLNPYIHFNTYLETLSRDNAIELFSKYDIIVDGSDNFPTRYLVNDAAVLTNKPVVFGSIFKFEGQVSVFNYINGPTYRCLYPNPPQAKAVPNCSEIGVLGVLPGIIGAFQANEVLKMVCKIGTPLSGKLLAFNALSMQQHVFSFKKNERIVITTLDKDYSSFCGVSSKLQDITYSAYRTQTTNYNLLDVRTDAERDKFHIGGLHIPLDELKERYNEIPQDKPLVVYCKSGMRSQAAISFLFEENFNANLVNLKNGLLEAHQ